MFAIPVPLRGDNCSSHHFHTKPRQHHCSSRPDEPRCWSCRLNVIVGSWWEEVGAFVLQRRIKMCKLKNRPHSILLMSPSTEIRCENVSPGKYQLFRGPSCGKYSASEQQWSGWQMALRGSWSETEQTADQISYIFRQRSTKSER